MAISSSRSSWSGTTVNPWIGLMDISRHACRADGAKGARE